MESRENKTPFMEIIQGCKKTLKENLEKIMKEFEKGYHSERNVFDLLMEIRDGERDIALFELSEKLFLEEVNKNG